MELQFLARSVIRDQAFADLVMVVASISERIGLAKDVEVEECMEDMDTEVIRQVQVVQAIVID